MNAPILADKQGTPARPTRGLLQTTFDSQNEQLGDVQLPTGVAGPVARLR